MTWKLTLKKHFVNCLYWSGALRLLQLERQKHKAFVLMYHRVLQFAEDQEVPSQPGMFVTQTSFRRHVSFLKSNFVVLPLPELVHRIETGRSIGGCCALTFDDGWLDNYSHAYKILKEFRLPATIFLATGFIGTDRMFWPEEASFYLQRPEVIAAGRYNRALMPIPDWRSKNVQKSEFIENTIDWLKNISTTEREAILSCLRSLCNKVLFKRLLLNWNEVREMMSEGLVNFGAHSHNHVILDQVSLAQAEQEIRQSRQEMERQLGISPIFFAYPNGNYSSDLHTVLMKNGFKAAFTTRKDWFGNQVPLFEIPRIGIHEDVSRSNPLFFSRILLDSF